jgi:hypothetical protein
MWFRTPTSLVWLSLSHFALSTAAIVAEPRMEVHVAAEAFLGSVHLWAMHRSHRKRAFISKVPPAPSDPLV